jgi:glycosyltransferase involved in cell wall biosynthesis
MRAVTPSFSIVIPAYNEAQRIAGTLEKVLHFVSERQWNAEIIVVNDGSRDDTAAVVRQFQSRHIPLLLVNNLVNAGKGRAIRDGVLRAVGDVILFTDADNSTPIEDSDLLIEAIANGADIAIGSRWIDRNLQHVPQPWYRRLNGRAYNLLLRMILGFDFKDTQNGFKAFTQAAGKAIFSRQKISGWGFDAEMLYLARTLSFSVREIPVSYVYYAEGSKIHPYLDGLRMLSELLKLKWNALSGAYSKISAPYEQLRNRLPTEALARAERPSEAILKRSIPLHSGRVRR